MLTDLRQFFTTKNNSENNFCFESPENFIFTIAKYQNPNIYEEIILQAENTEDWIEMIIESDLLDFEAMNIHFFMDILGTSMHNAVLNCFLFEEDYEIKEIDTPLEYLYDEQNNKFHDISEEYPKKTIKCINLFYQEAIDACSFEDGYDSYLASTIGFKLEYIKFKNKAKGRKIRKLFNKNKVVEELFGNLGFFMENGELLMMKYAYLEGNGFYDDYSSYYKVLIGIEECRRQLHRNENNDISELVSIFNECTNNEHRNMIFDFLEILESNMEVII